MRWSVINGSVHMRR